MIAIAFWLSGGFIKSGLGSRIAYSIVSLFGKTTLGLTYSLVFAEALLAPAIPSVAARAGGIFFPLAKVRTGFKAGERPVCYVVLCIFHNVSESCHHLEHVEQALCLACGSDPANGTEKKMGAYVMKTCFQTTCISSAMFITAMAANPLAVDLATGMLGQTITWGAWATAGLVPGIICLVATPAIL